MSAATLLTAEEYRQLPDNGQPTELIRGRVVTLNLPVPRHGEICANVVYLLRRFLEANPLGRVVGNDSGVVTERGPDTVRGPDVAYYSYDRVPRGPLPRRYLDVVPELVFEVRSHTDRWPRVLMKVSEYLEAGVGVACVLDDQTRTAHVFRAEEGPHEFADDEELTLPDVLADFRVVVGRFFE
jgi:Uma2 family endonuclease